MRRNSLFYFLVCFSLIYASCSKDENPEYFSVLGTVVKANDSTFVVSDEDERLLVNNASALSTINNNERIIAYFSMSDMAKPAGVDYVIDIYNFSPVLFKPVIELTPNIIDSIGNDPMTVRDLWLAKDYLNLNFEYYGSGNKIHYINLTRTPGEVATDTVLVEIKHNARLDPENYALNGFVSFDLQPLKSEGIDSLILHVRAKGYNNNTFNKFFTYKF